MAEQSSLPANDDCIARRPTHSLIGAFGWLFVPLIATAVCLAPFKWTAVLLLGREPEKSDLDVAITTTYVVLVGLLSLIAIGMDLNLDRKRILQSIPKAFVLWARFSVVRQVLALRGIKTFHLLLVSLLVPLWAISSATLGSAFRDDGISIRNPLEQEPEAFAILVGCIIAPISEEICYRGFLGRGLIAHYGVVRGVLFASILFGFVHWRPAQIIHATIFGVQLHVAYLLTRTIIGPLLWHILHNGICFALRRHEIQGLVVGTLWPQSGDNNGSALRVSVVIASITAELFLFFLLYQTRVRWLTPSGDAWSPGNASAEMPPASVQVHPSP